MFRILLWKELLEHLRSLRFALGSVTILGLFLVGAGLWNVRLAAERQAYAEGVRETEAKIEDQAARSLAILYHTTLSIWNPPSPLTFASDGYSRGMPNVARVSPRQVYSFEQRADPNPLFVNLEPDWVFVAGILGTLLALMLTCDAVAGEKERGTLRQLLANRVPRDQVLIAKYAAALLVAAAPLAVGALSALVIVRDAGIPNAALPSLIGVLAAALLCVSTFVWLGLWASSRTGSSALALLAGLVLWAGLAVLVPHGGVLVGEQLAPVPTATAFQRQLEAIAREAEHWNYETQDIPALLADQERRTARARQDYLESLLRQVEMARRATLLSPVVALRGVAEALTTTGVPRHRSFLQQAYDYSTDLADFLRARDAEDPDSPHRMRPGHLPTFSQKPVPAVQVPRYRFRSPSLTRRFDAALPPLLVLMGANLVAFLGAYLSFRRYDVR